MASPETTTPMEMRLFQLTIDLDTTPFPDLENDPRSTIHAFARHMLVIMARAGVIPAHAEAHLAITIEHEQRNAAEVRCRVCITTSIANIPPEHRSLCSPSTTGCDTATTTPATYAAADAWLTFLLVCDKRCQYYDGGARELTTAFVVKRKKARHAAPHANLDGTPFVAHMHGVPDRLREHQTSWDAFYPDADLGSSSTPNEEEGELRNNNNQTLVGPRRLSDQRASALSATAFFVLDALDESTRRAKRHAEAQAARSASLKRRIFSMDPREALRLAHLIEALVLSDAVAAVFEPTTDDPPAVASRIDGQRSAY